MNRARVLALLLMFVGLAHSFSWDIVVGEEQRIEFYHNGTLTHREVIPSSNYFITSVIYDQIHKRVLFADYNHPSMSISSFDMTNKKIQPLVTRKRTDYVSIAYDPVTQLLFWKEDDTKIYSLSLKPASSNKTVDANLLLTLEHYCSDIEVDSCGGYIYWITDNEIERARLDGSDREVLIDIPVYNRRSLAIDQHTQKIYWIEEINNDYNQLSIESADFNGNNRRTLYVIQNETYANSLTVSKDFIYWRGGTQETIWQLPKKPNSPQDAEDAKPFSISQRYCLDCQFIAANYKLKEQTQEINKCKALKSLIQNNSELGCTDVSQLCVHGTEVSGESRCECAQGYTGERCDVSLCHNYCLQGDCSISAEGQPQCSCKTGYSGERCDVSACHKHCLNDGVCSLSEAGEPVCRCTANHSGKRCEISACQNNCASAEGETKWRCNAGNFKESKVNACHQYCLNGGICSLNEDSEPVCQCTGDYEGDRCDVPAFLIKCFLYAYKNVSPVTLSKGVKSTCASTVV